MRKRSALNRLVPPPPRHADPPLQSSYELPNEGREDRRMLFIAIARGVVRHLQQNAHDGLVVTYDAGYRANVSINME